MGLSVEQQKRVHELMLQAKDKPAAAENGGCATAAGGCCQGPGFTCGRSSPQGTAAVSDIKINSNGEAAKHGGTTKVARKICSMPTWLERWEREDTYAALAVATAAVAVVVAYGCYKKNI